MNTDFKIGDHVEISDNLKAEVAGWSGVIINQGKSNKDEYLVDFQIGEECEVNPPRLYIHKEYLKPMNFSTENFFDGSKYFKLRPRTK